MKNQVWWFNWAGFTITEGASRSFVTSDGMTVTITFSQVSSHVPQPDIMNTWSGAVLHLLYDFTDPAIRPALHDAVSALGSTFYMTITASRDGLPVAFSLLAADAEASDPQEVTTLQTNGSKWQTIEFFRNSSQTINPVAGCNTQTVAINNTYGGASQTGQNPLLLTQSPAGAPLVIGVSLDHGGTTGGMAVAFGILQSADRGDLPASYGMAQHQLVYNINNACNYLPPLPYTSQDGTLKIGAVAGDADPIQYTDDNAIGADEDGVSSFPAYDGSGSYSLPVTLSNTTGNNAYLTGWFDYNRNGVFDNGESVTSLIPNNATAATLTWTGLPTFLPQGTATGYGFRLRLSSDAVATQKATGFAKDGEVEDYFITSTVLCSMKVLASPDSSVCAGQPVQLHATGGTQYNWDASTSLSDLTIANPVATPLSTTQYTVTAGNPQGCLAKSTVSLTVMPGLSVIKSNDTTICRGGSASLTAGGGASYSWSSSDGLTITSGPALVISPSTSTWYYVLVGDNNKCPGRDSIEVIVHTIPVFGVKPTDPSVCKNDTLVLTASGGDSYLWLSAAGNAFASTAGVVVKPAESQNYQVQITDDICQYTETLQVPVVVNDLPIATITKSNDINCTLGKAVLQAGGGMYYLWDSAGGISPGPGISNPVVQPLHTTTYYVTVTDNRGCAVKDSITVLADFTSAISKYPVASAFTPNNDGNNDCFGLKYWGPVITLELAVFNRWGERVFFTSNPNQCWNGTYKGKPQPPDTYIYQIKAVTACGTAYRKGTVLLIR